MEAKSLEKEKLLVIKIVKDITQFVDKQFTFSPRKLGVLPTKVPSCFFDILS